MDVLRLNTEGGQRRKFLQYASIGEKVWEGSGSSFYISL